MCLKTVRSSFPSLFSIFAKWSILKLMSNANNVMLAKQINEAKCRQEIKYRMHNRLQF